MRILLIDDSRTMRHLVKLVIAALGDHAVEEAANAFDGLIRCRDLKPELVLVDGEMPGMSGLEFVHAFRADHPHTPVLVISSDPDHQTKMDALSAGANAVIVKPFTPDLLSQRISELLETQPV
ncbi:MAG: response regulator [Phycisphaerales bacterium]